MKKIYERIRKLINEQIWVPDSEVKNKPRRMLLRFLRIISLGVQGFNEDKLTVRASALTYFTLLSIVPVLALGFGIAKGFGLDAVLEDEIAKNMAGQKEAMEYIISFTHSMLNSAKGGLVAGIGLALLLWSVMKLLMSIESAFNTIWEIEKARSYSRKFTDYFAIMLLSPILMIISSSSAVFLSTKITSATHQSALLEFAAPWVISIASIFPYIIVWILFTILYMVMPNTKVEFRSAVIAGIITGTAFQAFQGLYIYFQSSASRTSAIYGSFAALPLFLVWLQISWLLVLLGGEISYAVQNAGAKGSLVEEDEMSISFQRKIVLLISKVIIDRFSKAEKAIFAEEISEKTGVSLNSTNYILKRLTEVGIISKVITDNADKIAYQPALCISKIDIDKILTSYEKLGMSRESFLKKEEYGDFINTINNLFIENNTKNKTVLLRDI